MDMHHLTEKRDPANCFCELHLDAKPVWVRDSQVFFEGSLTLAHSPILKFLFHRRSGQTCSIFDSCFWFVAFDHEEAVIAMVTFAKNSPAHSNQQVLTF